MKELDLRSETFSTMSEQTLGKEVHAWRSRLRATKYLHPVDGRPHTNIDGSNLDSQLVDFSSHCKANQDTVNVLR
jgi:hypothetical protein